MDNLAYILEYINCCKLMTINKKYEVLKNNIQKKCIFLNTIIKVQIQTESILQLNTNSKILKTTKQFTNTPILITKPTNQIFTDYNYILSLAIENNTKILKTNDIKIPDELLIDITTYHLN